MNTKDGIVPYPWSVSGVESEVTERSYVTLSSYGLQSLLTYVFDRTARTQRPARRDVQDAIDVDHGITRRMHVLFSFRDSEIEACADF